MAKPFQKCTLALPDGMRVKAKTIDLSGLRFGRLLVGEVVGKSVRNSLLWSCTCDCGAEVVRSSSSLRKNKGVSSCGCYLREKRKTHLTENTWNKGKSYTLKKLDEVFKNKKAWATAVKRLKGDYCERCLWDKAPCDVHHVVPKELGGLNTVSNGAVLCPNCHRLEHIKLEGNKIV